MTHVNNATYNVFLAMEVELRRQIRTGVKPPNLRIVAAILKTSDDIQFYWCLLAANWEEEEAQVSLDLVWTYGPQFEVTHSPVCGLRSTRQKTKTLFKSPKACIKNYSVATTK